MNVCYMNVHCTVAKLVCTCTRNHKSVVRGETQSNKLPEKKREKFQLGNSKSNEMLINAE